MRPWRFFLWLTPVLRRPFLWSHWNQCAFELNCGCSFLYFTRIPSHFLPWGISEVYFPKKEVMSYCFFPQSELPLLQEKSPSLSLLGRTLLSRNSNRKTPDLRIGNFNRITKICALSNESTVNSIMSDVAKDYQVRDCSCLLVREFPGMRIHRIDWTSILETCSRSHSLQLCLVNLFIEIFESKRLPVSLIYICVLHDIPWSLFPIASDFVVASNWLRLLPWTLVQTLHAPLFLKPEADPKTVASIILGGGAGTRLFPLTKTRAKPAVRTILNCWLLFLGFFGKSLKQNSSEIANFSTRLGLM